MKFSLLCLLVAALAAAGCAQTTEPLTLEGCVQGAWLANDHACGTCVVGVTAECGQLDCIESTALLVRDDHQYLEFTMRRLETQHRFSAVFGRISSVGMGTWEVTPMDEFVESRADGSMLNATVGCDDTTLRRLGTVFGRPTVALEGGLFAAWEANVWSDRAY